MGALAGFVLGYILGAKAGPEGYEELLKAWKTIAESEEFKGLMLTGSTLLITFLNQGGRAVAEALGTMAARNKKPAGALAAIASNGDALSALSTIAKSEEAQALRASGISIIGNLLAQSRALAGAGLEKS